MDIIIHGKPNSSSSLSTSSLDSGLVDNITNRFFASKGDITNEKALIVETQCWKGQWYSLYTYSRKSGVVDVANRPSYFSISIIFHQLYLRLTSDVYVLLDSIYQKTIQGNYIDKAGKYMVSTFAGTQNIFNTICNEIESGLGDSNIAEEFDGTFNATSTETLQYNLLDCDSNAFINDLRKCGKIIVGEGNLFPAKCSNVVLMQKENQIKQLTATQTQLDSELQQVKEKLSKASNKSSKQINELNGQINNLQSRNNTLTAELSARNETLQQISALLPNARSGQQTVRDAGSETSSEDACKHYEPTYSKWLRYVPVINCVLLLLFVAIILGKPTTDGAKEKYQQKIDVLSNENKNYADSIIKLNRRLTTINQELNNANTTITALQSKESSATTISTENNVVPQDNIDANIRFTVNGNPAKPRQKDGFNHFSAHIGDTIVIKWSPTVGYQWNTTHLDLSEKNKLIEADSTATFNVSVTDNKQYFYAVYRSPGDNGNHAHKNNKFQINIVQ